MTSPGYATKKSASVWRQPVAILSVDASSNTATVLTRRESQIQVDLSYHVGSVQVTPSAGEQWYIVQQTSPTPRPGVTWVLDAKIPFNTPEITLPAIEGQQQIGTGKGPIQLHGTQVNANGPLRLANADSSLADSIERARGGHKRAASLPGASTVDAGSLVYNGAAPAFSDGLNWIQLGTYDLPSGGIPTSQLAADIQALLALAGTAYQMPTGGVPITGLDTAVQDFLYLAGTALQNSNGTVSLSNLLVGGTAAAGDSLIVDPTGTGLTFGTPATSGTATTSTALQDLINGMAGVLTGNPADLILVWTSLLSGLTGLASGTSITDFIGGIAPRLQYLSPNGLVNSQALDNIAESILRNLNGTGQFDAAQLFNIDNIPNIPQEAISGLTYTISQLVQVVDFQNLLQGLFGTTSIGSFLGVPGLLSGFGTSTSILTQLLGLFPGLAGGLTGLTGLGSVFTDLTGLLGSPTNLGSGSPALPGVGSIPLLGGLLGSGNLLGGGLSLASPLTSQLIGLFPGTTSGLSGLGGLGSVFTDLTGLLGGPTSLGSGSPTLPGVGSIPLLGGLFSGGTFLSGLIPGLDTSKIISGTFGAGLLQPFIDAISQGFGGLTGLGFPGLQSFLGGLPSLGNALDLVDPTVISALSPPIFQPLVNIVTGGGGGSTFPWVFPISFGAATNTIDQVGQAIANAATHSQQVLDTIVQRYTGTTAVGNSFAALEAALAQQPGSSMTGQLPAAVLPDITLGMSSALQAVHTTTGLNTSQINDIVQYAEQESAAAVGTFIQGASQVANAAQSFAGGAVDTINTVLGGLPVVGTELKDLFDQFTGFLTQTHNNWTGTTLPAATAPDVAAAALNSASQANAQSTLIASIQQQMPKFYGSGNSGNSYQTGFTGSLPAGFVALTPGSGVVYNCAINTSQPAQTDTQAVSGIWTSADGWAKALILRSNAAATSFHWAWWNSGTAQIGVRVAGVDHVLGTFSAPGFVANYAYQFEAIGRLLTLTGPGGLNVSVTDSGNVGLLGPTRCYGGFGTDGTIINTAGWGAPGGYTFYPPAGLVNGDMYDIYGTGGGGGGGGGVNTWGNGGGGGVYAENWGTGSSGNVSGSTIIGATNGPAVGQAISISIGAGGPPGSSEYYRTAEQEYYWYGGTSGLINDTTFANYGTSGAAGGASEASWSGSLGSGYVYCAGGNGGAAYGGSPTGGSSDWGGAQTGEALVNGSAPAYNGDGGNTYGGGGSGCYSGSGQTNASSWYDQFNNHWLGWQWGVNAAQTAGYGANGAMWIDSVSRQLPGPIASFAFWDAAIAGPTMELAVPASWSESTTSAAWTDLPTTTDQVTVNVGPSGIVLLFFNCAFAWNTAVNGDYAMGFAMSGANTSSAGADGYYADGQSNVDATGGTSASCLSWAGVLGAGASGPLNPGATTFKAKYSAGGNGGTANFGPRNISAVPL